MVSVSIILYVIWEIGSESCPWKSDTGINDLSAYVRHIWVEEWPANPHFYQYAQICGTWSTTMWLTLSHAIIDQAPACADVYHLLGATLGTWSKSVRVGRGAGWIRGDGGMWEWVCGMLVGLGESYPSGVEGSGEGGVLKIGQSGLGELVGKVQTPSPRVAFWICVHLGYTEHKFINLIYVVHLFRSSWPFFAAGMGGPGLNQPNSIRVAGRVEKQAWFHGRGGVRDSWPSLEGGSVPARTPLPISFLTGNRLVLIKMLQ